MLAGDSLVQYLVIEGVARSVELSVFGIHRKSRLVARTPDLSALEGRGCEPPMWE